MGSAPLLGWRRTSPALFRRGFVVPLAVMALVALLHVTLGPRIGCPAFVKVDPLYPGQFGEAVAKMASTYPFFIVALAAFNFAVLIQETLRGLRARRASTGEGWAVAFVRLVGRARRRYGGFLVHAGIAVMFLGVAGRAWGSDKEVSLRPGESVQIEEYTVTFVGARSEVDSEKRMLFADVDVTRNGAYVGRTSPAKFAYRTSPDNPSTEVARIATPRNDLYLVIGGIDQATGAASFQIHVNQFIGLLWLGCIIVVLGGLFGLSPEGALADALTGRRAVALATATHQG